MKRLFLCLVVAAAGVAGLQDVVNRDIINKKIERKLDISSQLVKVTNKITLENGGAAAVKSFLLALTPAEEENLSFANVQVSPGQARGQGAGVFLLLVSSVYLSWIPPSVVCNYQE